MRKTAFIIAGVILLGGILYFGDRAPAPSPSPEPAEEEQGVAMRIIPALEETPLYRISGEYPLFPGASPGFNDSIREYVEGNIAGFKEIAAENWRARQETLPPGEIREEFPSSPFYLSVRWDTEQVNERFVSLLIKISAYEGGANVREDLSTFNFDFRSGHPMRLADLFPDDPDYLRTVSARARERLAAVLGTDEFARSMIEAGTEPTEENFRNFAFNEEEVILYFPKYQVAPGAAGEQRVILSR